MTREGRKDLLCRLHYFNSLMAMAYPQHLTLSLPTIHLDSALQTGHLLLAQLSKPDMRKLYYPDLSALIWINLEISMSDSNENNGIKNEAIDPQLPQE